MKSNGYRPLTTGRFKTREALERHVLALHAVVKKRTHKQIASRVGISARKVQSILYNTQSKDTPRELINRVHKLRSDKVRLTLEQIGEECGVSANAARAVIKHYSYPTYKK